MSVDRRLSPLRPHKDMDFAVRSRDEKRIRVLDEEIRALKAQTDKMQRRLNAARAAMHNQNHANQIQERKLEQLRGKLHSVRSAFSVERKAFVQELEETRRVRDAERLVYEARISELEEKLQSMSSPSFPSPSPIPTQPASPWNCFMEPHFIAAVADAATELVDMTSQCRGVFPESPDDSSITFVPTVLDEGIQPVLDDEPHTPVVQETTELQGRCLELEAVVQQHQRRLEEFEAQEAILRALAEEARQFNDDLEDSFADLLSCKDDFIRDLREDTNELHASLSHSLSLQEELERHVRDSQDKLVNADIEIMDLRVQLEGAERNAVASTNRIVRLEADLTASRKTSASTDARAADLQEEVEISTRRIKYLEDEAQNNQDRLTVANSLLVDFRRDPAASVSTASSTTPLFAVDQYVQTDDDSSDDSDTLSDEGSVNTLVTYCDSPPMRSFDGCKVTEYLQDSDFDDSIPSARGLLEPSPGLVRSLEVQLEAMTLKFEAAEAARICGDDIEEILREKIRALAEDNRHLRSRHKSVFPQSPHMSNILSVHGQSFPSGQEHHIFDVNPNRPSVHGPLWLNSGPCTLSPFLSSHTASFSRASSRSASPMLRGFSGLDDVPSLLSWDLPPIEEDDSDCDAPDS